MTPYRERREKGYYNPEGKPTANTTTGKLAGLGSPQKAKPANGRRRKSK